MSLIALIGGLLTAVAGLLGNPKISSDPAILQQAQVILGEASNLAAQVAALPTSTPEESSSTPEIDATSAGTGGGSGTETTPDSQNIMQTKTISVSFEKSGDEGFVTITNDSGVSVRVKDLSVDGSLAGITIGKNYGEGYVYAPSFTDSMGKTFVALTCDGLGSLGKAVLPGNSIDPCRRKDANVAVNELGVGEQMILRYTGEPSAVTYAPESIVEVETGNDVTF